MTVREMIVEVYENSVEETELSPYTAGVFDFTSSGAIKCLGYLNRAYQFVLTYKDARRRRLRFHGRRATANFKSQVVTGTAQAGGGDDTIVLGSGAVTSDDLYNNWIVKITSGTGSGQIRIIMDSVNGTDICTINRDWATNPDDTSVYALYKNFYTLGDMGISPDENIYGILKLWDVEQKRELTKLGRAASFVEVLENYVRPTSWIYNMNQLIFNYAPYDERWFKVEYWALPADLSAEDQVPELPAPFHEVMIMWAGWTISKKAGNEDSAQLVYRDLRSTLNSIITEEDVSNDRLDGYWNAYTGEI